MFYERYILPPAWGSQPICIRFHSHFFLSATIHFSLLYQVTPTVNKDLQGKKLKTSKNPISLSKDLTVSSSLYSKFSQVLSGLSTSPILPCHSLLQSLSSGSHLTSPSRNIWHSHYFFLESFCSLVCLYPALFFKNTLISRPLCLLFPLPKIPFHQISVFLALPPPPPSNLCSNIISGSHFLTLFKTRITYSHTFWRSPFSLN